MKPPLMKGRPDNYQTPKIAWEYLKPYIKKEWTVWECASGEGQLYTFIKEDGFTVIGSDKEYDFLRQPTKDCDCIITNPPYSLKDEFIERCYAINKPFALLMPLTALEGKRRQREFAEHGVQMIIPPKRINFKTPSGQGRSAWFATAWFCYKLNLPKEINFITIAKSLHTTGQYDPS